VKERKYNSTHAKTNQNDVRSYEFQVPTTNRFEVLATKCGYDISMQGSEKLSTDRKFAKVKVGTDAGKHKVEPKLQNIKRCKQPVRNLINK
jgi:hypothetical protein